MKYPINLHKGLTFLFVIFLMFYYNNFNIGPFVYLALHGTYGILWILKDRLFPDKQWEKTISLGYALFTFSGLCLYWVAPFLLISSNQQPPSYLIALAVSFNIFGVMLHFGSDAQKYFTLKYHSGLITEGFFARCRNTNYLGEVMIYSSFATLTQHWIPFAVIALFVAFIFVPNMIKKDKSLAAIHNGRTIKRKLDFSSPKSNLPYSQAILIVFLMVRCLTERMAFPEIGLFLRFYSSSIQYHGRLQ